MIYDKKNNIQKNDKNLNIFYSAVGRLSTLDIL